MRQRGGFHLLDKLRLGNWAGDAVDPELRGEIAEEHLFKGQAGGRLGCKLPCVASARVFVCAPVACDACVSELFV